MGRHTAPYLLRFRLRNLHQCDYGLIGTIPGVNQLLNGRCIGVTNIVAQENRERLIGHRRFGCEHRMTEAEGFPLSDTDDFRQSCSFQNGFYELRLAVGCEVTFQVWATIKVIDERVFTFGGDKPPARCPLRRLQPQCRRCTVDPRSATFPSNGFRDRQESGAESGDRDHSRSNSMVPILNSEFEVLSVRLRRSVVLLRFCSQCSEWPLVGQSAVFLKYLRHNHTVPVFAIVDSLKRKLILRISTRS